MKYFLVFLVYTTFEHVKIADSAVSRFPTEPKPEYYADQSGCYLKSIDRFLPVNQPYRPVDGSCTEYTCQADNGETLMYTCGAVPPEYTCNRDITKPYPDCCTGELCPTTTTSTTPAPTTTTAKPAENPLGNVILNSTVPVGPPTPAPQVSTKNPAVVKSGGSQASVAAVGKKTNTLAYAAPGRSQANAQSSS